MNAKPLTLKYPDLKDLTDEELKDETKVKTKIKQMNDFIQNYDTSLTDSQKAHVAKLKKQIKGAAAKPCA